MRVNAEMNQGPRECRCVLRLLHAHPKDKRRIIAEPPLFSTRMWPEKMSHRRRDHRGQPAFFDGVTCREPASRRFEQRNFATTTRVRVGAAGMKRASGGRI